MRKFDSSYGQVEIDFPKEYQISVRFLEGDDYSFPEAEMVAQEYLDEHPNGGHCDQNEVQRAEYCNGKYYAEIF